ncbi:uncharacterized protein LOC127118476 [Lathyrus oleraceus]|uniref:Exocyst subunit Exo70 family protein n=1 Tax=Pisum sativum TaxID=3888 RepID=A0A9D5B4D6_PEA|nr:uncharacterized protein LOC127118476 [Pisum sativum]KAI5435022.1 hypothetical protein KIW84_021742 [Pisum sativum]
MRSLMQPKIWRFVCFVSSVVGLLSYALSSSFNHLFGKWNFLKVFLYTIFSFIICLTILYANTCQTSSISLGLKAHLVFSVFTITTVYSFFFDKANGKPDLYSLISCAAFAIMSLSLSKQTHFGFEVDLLYFFCGYLTLQLMKIKLFLVVVGVIFSYFLIILRFYLGNPIESVHHRLQFQDQHSVVIQVQPESSTASENVHLIIREESNNSESAQVNSGQENMDLRPVIQTNSVDKGRIKMEKYTRTLTKMNEKLNQMIWPEFINNINNNNNNHFIVWQHSYKITGMENVIDGLNKIVGMMVKSGFKTQCCELYNSFRDNFLNMCLCRLGLQDVNLYDFEDKSTQSLINAFYMTLRILLPNERRIWGRVFSGFSLDCCIFSKLKWRRMEIELWKKLLVSETHSGYNRLKDTFLGCEVHPFTHEVMKCILNVSEDKDNAASFHIHDLIQLLHSNLVAKSKNYTNDTLRNLFMLNNNRYIELVARYPPLKTLLGEDWSQKQTSTVHRNIRKYIEYSWNKVLNIIKKSESMAPNVESMRLFNIYFSYICIRESMRRSLNKILLPEYEKFIGRFKDVHGKDVADMYIKYGMSDIEDGLDYFFGENDLGKKRTDSINKGQLRTDSINRHQNPTVGETKQNTTILRPRILPGNNENT